MGKMVRLPWVNVSLAAMIGDVIGQGRVTLTVSPRLDVQRGRWYTLEWTGADEQPHTVSGSEMQLTLRRAAEIEQAARMQIEDWDDH